MVHRVPLDGSQQHLLATDSRSSSYCRDADFRSGFRISTWAVLR
jgi:hypothetical protein